jgi:hypothetical protein
MNRIWRRALTKHSPRMSIAIAASLALVFGVSAAAGILPALTVASAPNSPQTATRVFCPYSNTRAFFVDPGLYGDQPGETGVGLCAPGPATAKVVLFAPAGVVMSFGAKPGTVIGRLSAKSDRVGKKIGIDFPLRNGSIVAADPKRYAQNRCSPGVHDAVWLLRTKTVDGRFVIRLPLYVDKIDPAAANANSVYRMQMCFSSPNGRTRISGWPSRTLFRTMNLLFDSSVISEQPTIPARYVWHGVFTPFRANGRPNPAARVESQATQLLPVVWTLSGSYDPTQHVAHISGSLTEGGQPVQPIRNDPYGFQGVLWHGTALGGSFPGIVNATAGPLSLDDSGHFSETVPIAQTTYFRASGGTVLGHFGRAACKPPTIAPKGCVSATRSGFARGSLIIEVTVP